MTIVDEDDDIMVVTANGIVSRIKAGDISRQGRPATGVKIQNIMENDQVCTVNKIECKDEDEEILPKTQPETENAEQTKLID